MKTPILTKLSKALFEEFNTLTEDEINVLNEECKKISTTNCGWSQYAIAKMLEDSVSAHVGNRDIRAY